jgi:hypothetical protein
VRHPLEAVRKTIRRYVLLESAAILLLCLALWFWIGLALDFGLFWTTAYDWVMELNFIDPSGQGSLFIRLAVFALVVGFLLYLLVSQLVVRYWKEFSDPAVALVLERRFPQELGDRLITAIELADPKKAASYGYSAPMLARTIDEAAERVERLPVDDVFDWARLRRRWRTVAFATVGVLLIVALGSIGVETAQGRAAGPFEQAYRFRDVASIWVERNVFFRNSYWQRNNHLEVVRFQDNESHPGEMRVGRDEQRPDLVVRAVEWVVPDRAAPVGWRALRVADLGSFVPADLVARITIPAAWPGWIVDLDDLDARIPVGAVAQNTQGKTFGELDAELAAHKGPAVDRDIAAARRAHGDW